MSGNPERSAARTTMLVVIDLIAVMILLVRCATPALTVMAVAGMLLGAAMSAAAAGYRLGANDAKKERKP